MYNSLDYTLKTIIQARAPTAWTMSNGLDKTPRPLRTKLKKGKPFIVETFMPLTIVPSDQWHENLWCI